MPGDATDTLIESLGSLGLLVNTGCVKVKIKGFRVTGFDGSVTSVISCLKGQSLTSY